MNNVNDFLTNFKLPALNKPRNNQSEFLDDLIYVANATRCLTGICCSLVPKESNKKIQQAVLTGLIVKAYKLFDSIIFLASKERMETCTLILRSLIETAFILIYLISENNNRLYDKFIISSLAYDKKLLEEMLSINNEQQDDWTKMLEENIKNRIKQLGYDYNQINFKTDKKWLPLNMYEIAEKLNLTREYEFGFRSMSRSIHPGWHELEMYHVTENENTFIPELEFHQTHPFLLISATQSVIRAAICYAKYTHDDQESTSTILSTFEGIINWHFDISKVYESFRHNSKSNE